MLDNISIDDWATEDEPILTTEGLKQEITKIWEESILYKIINP